MFNASWPELTIAHPESPINRKMQQHQQQAQPPRIKRPPTYSREAAAGPRYTHPTANSSAHKRASKLILPSDSSWSSSRSCLHCPLDSTTHYSDVAATDPNHTTLLWKTVITYLDDTKSSRGKSRAESVTSESTLASRQHKQQTPATSAPLSVGTRKETAAKVTDLDFMEAVLEPYGITIQKKGMQRDLYKYFRLSGLPRDPQSRLNIYKSALTLNVWLEPNIAHIEREYEAMQVYGSNEAEYSAYALCNIFVDEPRYPWLPQQKGEKRWLPVRMLQLVHKPPQDEWHPPPDIQPLKKRYEWDIRPDCAYHVSLQAFQPGFRTAIQQHVSVVQKRAFCPYLTIEFKKDEDSLATARHQVAVASAIALYNRYRLKCCALQMSGDEWSEEHMNQMRHYGITFAGSSWNLWCTVPKTFPDWTGCNMSTIYSGDCCILADVQKLVSAVNDIHYWGLQIHGKSCKADIYAKIRSDPDADSNDISILEDHSE